MTTRNLINEFLSVKRFAMAGVSRNQGDFSRTLFNEFIRRGCDVVPVNPGVAAIGDRRCYKRLQEIQPPVTSALLMTSRPATGRVLLDCAEAGVTLVWIYGISGERDIDPGAMKTCRDHGIEVVPGYCPFMFLPGVPFYHRLHGYVWKAIGRYPV